MSETHATAVNAELYRRLVEKMMSAVKTGALYGEDHPQRRRLTVDAHAAFEAVAEATDGVSLESTPEGLEVSGVPVDGDDSADLARRLASGGVRRLDLSDGLTIEEIDGLTSLIALDFERMKLEEDLTTLLWSRNWPSVSWEAFEVPSEAVDDAEEASGFNSSLPDQPPIRPLDPTEWATTDFALTDEEEASLRREIDQAETDPPIAEVGSVLCQIVALEKNVKHVEPVLESLRALMDRCLRSGRFAAAGETAHLLDRFGKDPEALTDEKLRAIRECQDSFVSPDAVDVAMPVLERGEWDDPDAASAFLEQLEPGALPRVLDAFFTLEHERARCVLRKALITMLRRDLSGLVERISSYSGASLIEIVDLLGDVASKDVVPVLQDVLRTGTRHARLATIDALARAGGAHAHTVVARALGDDDREVRCRAAQALPEMGATEGLDPLLREMLRGEFRDRDLDERMIFFRSLGSTNVPEVLPFLKRILQRRGWAFLGRRDEERRCAAAALLVMTHPEAMALRAELEHSGAKDIRALLGAEHEEL